MPKLSMAARLVLKIFYISVSGIYMGVAMYDFLHGFVEPQPCGMQRAPAAAHAGVKAGK